MPTPLRPVSLIEVIGALEAFPPRSRPVLLGFIGSSRARFDLIAAFPVLLYALATRYPGLEASRTAAAALDNGRSLKVVAALARVPWWTRLISPAACAGSLPFLPDEPAFAEQIQAWLNDHPIAPDKHAAMLQAVSFLAQAAGPAAGLWLARHFHELDPGKLPPIPYGVLALYISFSQQEGTLGRRLIHTPWQPRAALGTALQYSINFSGRLQLALLHHGRTLTAWYPPGECDGFTMVPLLGPAETLEEAASQQICIDSATYVQMALGNQIRFYSVRHGGARIATFAIERMRVPPNKAALGQISGFANRTPPDPVRRAVETWFRGSLSRHPMPDLTPRPIENPSAAALDAVLGAYLASAGGEWLPRPLTLADLNRQHGELRELATSIGVKSWKFG